MSDKLRMLWSPSWGAPPPEQALPEGLTLRRLEDDDVPGWLALMEDSGFFNEATTEAPALLQEFRPRMIPEDWLGVFRGENSLVASCFTVRGTLEEALSSTELMYIAVLSTMRGHRLGRAITTRHMHQAAERNEINVFAETDDFRLASIANTLHLGFLPLIYTPDMEDRWRTIFLQLALPCEPESWPRKAVRAN